MMPRKSPMIGHRRTAIRNTTRRTKGQKWKSFDPHKPGGVSIGTLDWMARERGWQGCPNFEMPEMPDFTFGGREQGPPKENEPSGGREQEPPDGGDDPPKGNDPPPNFTMGGKEAEPKKGPPVLKLFNPADFEGKEIKPREWIVPDYVPDKTVTLLYADGGTGKDYLN